MTTIVLPYKTDQASSEFIAEYIMQYNSCLHVVYNYIRKSNLSTNYQDHIIGGSEVKYVIDSLNNIGLIQQNYHIKNCLIANACDMIKSEEERKKTDLSKINGYNDDIKELHGKIKTAGKRSKKTIAKRIRKIESNIRSIQKRKYVTVFGGRSNFISRCKGNISNSELKELRLYGLYSKGDKEHFNRLFCFKDYSTIIFKPNQDCHVELQLIGNQYRNQINSLLIAQENRETAVTFKLTKDKIYISYEEGELTHAKYGNRTYVENRVMSIDLNPNYVGWCITDWKSENDFNIIKSGVLSIKQINDIHFKLKGKHVSSENPERIYLNNKRLHEIFEISKSLVNLAAHYKCEMFCVEDLKMNADDKNKGRKYNALVNNLWNRTAFVDNLHKRCNIFHIKFKKVLPNYSSFVGNFLFRSLGLPDMCLAAFELGRRAYQYKYNYLIPEDQRKKNIVLPDCEMFKSFLSKSLEEFGLVNEFHGLVKTYNSFKKANKMYRLSLDQFDLEFSRFSSSKSLVEYHRFDDILLQT